jgi:hypothetical protein
MSREVADAAALYATAFVVDWAAVPQVPATVYVPALASIR